MPFPLEPDPVVEAYTAHVDVTLVRASLKLTHTERMERLIDLAAFARELRRAGRIARAGE
jgi:hypothetical protein